MIKKIICNLLLSFFLFFSGSVLANSEKKEISEIKKLWKNLPIQHQGRVKPFDTFSREVLRTVYGKENYQNRSAVEVILSWLIIPDFWDKTELILIEKKELKKGLDLPIKQKRFSPSDLQYNQKLALQLVELKSLKQKEETLDSYFQSLEKLETRLLLYSLVQTGFLIRLEPNPEANSWLSLSEMSKAVEDQFKKLISVYVRFISEHISSFFLESSPNRNALDFDKGKALDVFSERESDITSLLKDKKDSKFEKKISPKEKKCFLNPF